MRTVKSRSKAKKSIGKIINFLSVLIILICLFLLVFATVSLAKNHFVRVFGYSFHLVVTDSMSPEILVGDLAVAQKTDNQDIKINDDIVFISQDPLLRGNMVVHRVVEIDENGDFRTQGIKEGAPIDSYAVSDPIGKVVAVNSNVGKIFGFVVKYKVFVFIGFLMFLATIIIWEMVGASYKSKKKNQ